MLFSSIEGVETVAPYAEHLSIEPLQSAPAAASAPHGLSASLGSTISWNTDGSGFWDDAANWSGGVVPGPDDDVIIDRGAQEPTITIRTVVSVKSLQSSEDLLISNSLTLAEESDLGGNVTIGGNLMANGPLTLSGNTTWNSGALGGTATITNTGALTYPINNLSINTDFDNAGTFNWGGDQMAVLAGKTFTNLSGGILNLTGSASNAGALKNDGEINVTGGAFSRLYNLVNSGDVNVEFGTLYLRGGSTSGAFDVSTGKTLAFEAGSGNFAIQDGATFDGAGLYLVTGFATVAVDAGTSISISNLKVEGFAQLGGEGEVVIPASGKAVLDGGSFYGSGLTTVKAGATLEVIGGSLETHVMDLYGTLNLTGGLNLHDASTLNVQSGGVVNLSSTATFTGPAASFINLIGTLNGNAAAGTSVGISGPGIGIAGSGVVHAITGNLYVGGAMTTSGTFNADAGANISFNGAFSTYEFSAGTTLQGNGHYYVDYNTTVSIPTGVTLTPHDLQINGTLTGAGTLSMASGSTLSFLADGIMSGTGITEILAGATLKIGGATPAAAATVSVNTRTLNNSGTMTINGRLNCTVAATLNNYGGALIDFVGTYAGGLSVFGYRFTVNNSGAIKVGGNITEMTIDSTMNNHGLIETVAGGPLALTISRLNTVTSGISDGEFRAGAGTSIVISSSMTFNSGVSWTGAGMHSLAQGSFVLASGVTYSPQHVAISTSVSVNGPGAVAVPANASWTYGFGLSLLDLASFTIGTGATFAGSLLVVDNTPVTNNGLMTVNYTSGSIILNDGAVFTNSPTGEVRFTGITATGSITSGHGTGNSFVNNGKLTILGNAGTFNVNTVSFSSAGTFQLDGGAGILQSGAALYGRLPQLSADGATLTGGTWNITSGGHFTINQIKTQDDFGNPLVSVVNNAASVTLSGAGASFNAMNNLATNSGSLKLLEGASLEIYQYILDPGQNAGNAPFPGSLVNSGAIEIGEGARLNAGVDYTQLAAGVLHIHVGGTAASNEYGKLIIGNTATLGGELAVTLDNFAPETGESYTILSFAQRSGYFDTFTGLAPAFSASSTATEYRLLAAGVVADLTPLSIDVTTTGVPGSNITIDYSVQNGGSGATGAGPWTDSFYLSPTPYFDAATALLIGRKQHDGDVPPGAAYDDSLTGALPSAAPGIYYVILIANSRGELSEGSDGNNTLASDPLSVSVPDLTMGVPLNGTISAGQKQFYRIDVPYGSTKFLITTGAAGAVEILLRKGDVPTPGTAEYSAYDPGATGQSIAVTGPGEYFIELIGTAAAGAGTSTTILPSQPVFGLDSAGPASGPNNGRVTLTVHGAQFTEGTTFSLVPGSAPTLLPINVVVKDSNTAFVTFELTGTAIGSYALKAVNGGNTVTLPGAFSVTAAPVVVTENAVTVRISGPSSFRVGRATPVLVTYRNDTNADLPVPLILVTTDNGAFLVPGEVGHLEDYFVFFGLSQNGSNPGVLAPGESGSIILNLLPEIQESGVAVNYAASLVDPKAAVDYAEITRLLRPAGFTDAQWAPVLQHLQSQLGATYGAYGQKLADDIQLLPELEPDAKYVQPIEMLGLELDDALAATGTSIHGYGTHAESRDVVATNTATGEVFTTTSRADGSYVFPRVTPGDYVLRWEGSLINSGGTFTVAEGEHYSADLYLSEGSNLFGTVASAGTGVPVANTRVDITSADGTHYQTVADADGAYSITGLAAGPFEIFYTAEGKARGYIGNAASGEVNASLQPEGRMDGTIVLGNGGPVGALIQLDAALPTGGHFFSHVTQDTLAIALGQLPSGDYDLDITADGYVPVKITGITVTNRVTTHLGDVPLNVAATVTGTLTSLDPALPVPGALIVASSGGVPVASATVDANGHYVISGLSAGSYTIDIFAAAGFRTPVNVNLTGGQTVNGIDLTLLPGGQIGGAVTVGGEAIEGLSITATNSAGVVQEVYTDSQGNYAFQGLALGTYRVAIRGGAGALASATVIVTALSGDPVLAELQATFAAEIQGQVKLADNSPVETGRVVLIQNGEVVASTESDADGRYRFFLSLTGSFTVQATASGASFAPVAGVAVDDGDVITHDFVAGLGQLHLEVTDAEGNAGDIVYILQEETGEIIGQYTLDASGVLSLAHLAPGSYTAIVDGEGRSARGTGSFVADGEAQLNLTVVAASSLTGTITAPGGPGALAAAFVALYPAGGGGASIAAINSDGTYSFPTLDAGTYTAVVVSRGFLAQVTEGVVISGSASLDATLTASTSSVNGRVVDANGAPVAGIAASIEDGSGHTLGVAQTNANGEFTITSAVGANLHLFISPIDGQAKEYPAPVAIQPGDAINAGQISYTFTALSSHLLSASGGAVATASETATPDLTKPSFDTPAIIIRILALNAQKANFDIDPPSNDCEERCFGEYAAALAAVSATDGAFAALKTAEGALKSQATKVLAAFILDAAPLVSLVAGTILILPASTVALETIGSGYLLAAGIAGLVDMVNTVYQFVSSEDPKDSIDIFSFFAGTQVKTLDSFGNIVKVLAKAAAGGGEALFKHLGPIGIILDSLTLVKKTLEGTLFQNTEQQLQNLQACQNQYDGASQQYYQVLSKAYGKVADYERCRANESVDTAAASASDSCNRPPPPPPNYPPNTGGGNQAASFDPNDITGPAGYGDEHYVAASQPLAYTIHFENQPSATAAAAEVVVTQQLDPHLDLSMFQLTGFGFGENQYTIPAGHSSYEARLDLTATLGIYVDVNASLNQQTRLLTWTFTSIDSLTGDIPADASVGFLPPDNSAGDGEGFVSYMVTPKQTVQTGDVVNASASIVFDTNAPIETAAISNKLDASAPVSQIVALPSQVGPDITLNWTGATDTGSGIAGYNLYVSDSGSVYQPLATGLTRTAYIFTGDVGHHYSFVVSAVDHAGNAEALPNTPDVSVEVITPAVLTVDKHRAATFNDQNGDLVTIKLSGPGSGTVRLVNGVANNADLRSLTLTDTTAATAISITVKKAGAGNGSTIAGRITTEDAVGSLKSLTLGAGVTLGDGADDFSNDLTINGAIAKLALSDLSAFAQIDIGGNLNDAGKAALKPAFTAGNVLGVYASIAIHGGLGKTTFKSWNPIGFLSTEQSVASLTVTSGNFSPFVDIDADALFAGNASLGAVNIAKGSLLSPNINVEGSIKSMTVKGSFETFARGSGIGAVSAAGFQFATLLAGAGGIGNVTATSTGMRSTFITAVASAIGNITAKLVKAVGEVSAMAGVNASGSKIGTITATVSGQPTLTRATGIEYSDFTATNGNIGSIVATTSGGSGLAESYAILASDFTSSGSIGSITASVVSSNAAAFLVGLEQGSFTAGQKIGNISAKAQVMNSQTTGSSTYGLHSSEDDLIISAGTSIGSIKVSAAGGGGSNVALATDLASHIRFIAGANIGAITFTASTGKAAGSAYALSDVNISADGSIGKITINGAATETQAARLNVFAGGSIGGLAISSSTHPSVGSLQDSTILAGQLAPILTNADLAKTGISSIKISGSLFDDTGAFASTIAARGNIGSVSIGASLIRVSIAAGISAGPDRVLYTADDSANTAGVIKSVAVSGEFYGSNLIAGTGTGSDLFWGTGSDPIGATIPGVTQRSKIGTITLGAITLPIGATADLLSPAVLDHTSAIESITLTSLKIGKFPVHKNFSVAAWIDSDGNAIEDTKETVVKLMEMV